MNILGLRWQSVCAILCVCVQLSNAKGINVYVINPRIHDLRAVETEPVSGEITNEPPPYMGRKLIPIKAPRVSKIRLLPLEPDAEMLPAHYEGVKPPGVDHMELKYAETQITQDIPKIEPLKGSDRSGDAVLLVKNQKSDVEGNKDELQKTISIETEQTGDDLTKKTKTEYTDVAGTKQTREEVDNNSESNSEEDKGKDEASRRAKGNDKVDRLTTGYRNVYHKDEYNKNHDYYDNDDEGGLSKQHGRYNERHVATEGTYKKGDSNRSGYEEEEREKQEAAQNSQANGETKGHGGFLKNFQGFAK